MSTTTKQETATDTELRKEFAELKEQVLTMTELLKKKGEQESSNVKQNIKENYDNVREKAKEHLHHAQEAGVDGIEKVSGKVKQNPFASLLVAFGAGYLISKSFKKDE
tara:strand:+ start:34487 stop:34810 length:324 start_codon:yes stop_codon:yes gene_type:complete